jgi:lysophospholipase L1-like esterase
MKQDAASIVRGCFRTVFFFSLLLAGCVSVPPLEPTSSPTAFPTLTSSPSAAPSATSTFSPTDTPLPSPLPQPLTLVFYGDSVLKVGDENQAGSEGFSFVDPLRSMIPAADYIIVSNHGGRRARWGFENLPQYVLRFQPDLVTLWWGMNDLGGCPGIFDRDTNILLQYKLKALLAEHLQYLQAQVDALLEQDIEVIVVTPIPVLGTLPWSHFTADNQLVWENDHRCDFNLGLEQLVQGQRSLLADYSAAGKPVYLLDAWQIYIDHPNSDKMYMDVVHPASHGAALIAEAWFQVFQSLDFNR